MAEIIAGRYEQLDLLGEGSQGTVYRARDTWTSSLVAVKRLRGFAPVDGARETAGLLHPNIVTVVDAGVDRSGSYITMEYVEGPSLRDVYLSSGESGLRAVLADVCLGLRCAHDRGIRHGDLKPHNILIDARHGGLRGKVGDFGFWSAVNASGESFAGTVAYAAPEVLRAERADHRADLYSLGALLYETVAGAPLFTGPDTRSVADAHFHTAPPDPRTRNPAVSPDLCDLIGSLVAKEPSQRPSSAADVADRLRTDSPQRSLGEPAWIPRRRPLDLLAQLESRATQREGSVVIVAGEAGSGKSSLLREFSLDAGIRGRPRILFQCGQMQEGQASAEELLRRTCLCGNPQTWMAISFAGIAVEDMARRWVDGLRVVAGDGCVVVMLDDLGRADPDLLNLFHAAWPQLAREKVLLIVTVDSDALPRLTGVVPRLSAVPHVHRISLRAFTLGETQQVLASMLCWPEVDAELTALVHRVSGGNPGLTVDVTRLLVERGVLVRRRNMWIVTDPAHAWLADARPNRIGASRLQSLTPDEARTLGVMALIGRGVPDDMLTAVAGGDRGGLERALSSLEIRGLVSSGTGTWRIRQGIVATAAQAELTREEQARTHALAAAYIRSQWPDSPDWVEPLAYYLAGAGQIGDARRIALAGGDEARLGGRYGRAVALYGLAMPEGPVCGDEIEAQARWGRGACLVTLGQWPLAAADLAAVLAPSLSSFLTAEQRLTARMSLARTLAADGRRNEAAAAVQHILDEVKPNDPRHADALAIAALVAAEGREWARATELARASLAELPDTSDETTRARVENTLGVGLMMQGQLKESLPPLTASLQRRTALGESIDAGRCALNLSIASRMAGQYDQARIHAENAERIFAKAGAVAWQAQVLNAHGVIENFAGLASKASRLFEEAYRLAMSSGQWRVAGLALNNLGMAQRAQGEWGKAFDQFHEARRIGRLRGDPRMIQLAATNLGDLYAAKGEYADAQRWHLDGLDRAERDGNPLSAAICRLGLAWVSREQGLLEQTEDHLARATKVLEPGGDARALIHAYCETSKLRLAQGRISEATDALERATRVSEMGIYERAMVLRLKGEVSGMGGKVEEARDAFRACLELLEPTELLYGRTLAALALGRWLASSGPVSPFRTAEHYLSSARDAFRRMGAPRRVEEAERELDKLAVAPGITPSSGADSRKLSLLYRMLSLVNAPGSSGDAVERILDLAVHGVHAQRGLVILVSPESGELAVRAQIDIDGTTMADARRLSGTVVRSVAGAGAPVFSADALGDSRFASYESIKLHRIACFMCVPLTLRDHTIGTIYVDSCSLEHRFTEDDVAFLQAFANHAAIAMENLRHREELERENVCLQEELKASHAFGTIVGHSTPMQAVYRTMVAVARSTVTVMIQGPTGTGKELVARAIHFNGPRAAKRFVAVNCGAFPDTLLESELFGYVRGAFTGAIRTTAGLFQTADGGTIFLDEVADMSPGLQAKVLRVLETGEVKQLGDPAIRHVDVRVLCATNRDLEAEVRAGRFRDDLYYRLRVVNIRMPTLRERPQDIPVLAVHFLKLYHDRLGSNVKGFSEDALAMLCRRDWPGNVRELEHTVEAALALCQGRLITADALSQAMGAPVPPDAGEHTGSCLAETLRAVERHCIARALESTGGNVSAAARELAVDRRQLQRLMRRYDFRPVRDNV